jgi:hypothetical protein
LEGEEDFPMRYCFRVLIVLVAAFVVSPAIKAQ